jgi:2-octaprenyl-6-methoxyphenol hydroxylase
MKPILSSAQVVIQGGGPVGLACAIFLLKNNPDLSLVLLDKNSDDDLSLTNSDTRGIAISEGSKQLLENIHAWVNEAPPIHFVHVSHKGHFGRTVMSSDEIGQSALGHIVRYKDILIALRKQLRALSTGASQFKWLNQVSEVITIDNCPQNCCLIHADGGLFHEQSAKDIQKDYGQSALVGWFNTENIPNNTAWERFTSQGPIAVLPHHNGQNTKNFVWCASKEKISQLIDLSDSAFLEAFIDELQMPIGKFVEVHDRRAYPLGLNIKKEITCGHEAWIGNAAQTLHPVAGQGLNLGLRDAFTLATCINQVFARSHNLPQDLISALQTYQDLRQSDRNITIRITDLMASVFATNLFPVVAARGLALSALQWFPGIKNKLARQMMFGQR